MMVHGGVDHGQRPGEKRVVAEERRLRVDAAPLGRFNEDFNRKMLRNNYGRPVIGRNV